jgi:hypothetical protein
MVTLSESELVGLLRDKLKLYKIKALLCSDLDERVLLASICAVLQMK